MGSMIRTYREVEERLAEAAGATAGQRLQTWRLPALYLSSEPRWRRRGRATRGSGRGLGAQMRILRHAAEGYFDSPRQTPSA